MKLGTREIITLLYGVVFMCATSACGQGVEPERKATIWDTTAEQVEPVVPGAFPPATIALPFVPDDSDLVMKSQHIWIQNMGLCPSSPPDVRKRCRMLRRDEWTKGGDAFASWYIEQFEAAAYSGHVGAGMFLVYAALTDTDTARDYIFNMIDKGPEYSGDHYGSVLKAFSRLDLADNPEWHDIALDKAQKVYRESRNKQTRIQAITCAEHNLIGEPEIDSKTKKLRVRSQAAPPKSPEGRFREWMREVEHDENIPHKVRERAVHVMERFEPNRSRPHDFRGSVETPLNR